jgi:hypothetical protein
MVTHTSNSSYLGDRDRKISSSRPVLAKLVETLFQKQNTRKGPENVAQVVECLPGMSEALNLFPAFQKQKQKQMK